MLQRQRKGNVGIGLLVLLVVVVGFFYFYPEHLRLGGRTQPPVAASVRDSVLGLGRVLQLRVQGDKAIRNVQVEAVNTAKDSHASYRFDVIKPGTVEELGWREWGWSLDPSETISVSADGYALPITFTSAQLGVK